NSTLLEIWNCRDVNAEMLAANNGNPIWNINREAVYRINNSVDQSDYSVNRRCDKSSDGLEDSTEDIHDSLPCFFPISGENSGYEFYNSLEYIDYAADHLTNILQ